MTLKIIRPTEVPKYIVHKGKRYNQGVMYANLEECRREMKYLLEKGKDVIMRRYNIQIFPGAKVMVRYQIYYGGKK